MVDSGLKVETTKQSLRRESSLLTENFVGCGRTRDPHYYISARRSKLPKHNLPAASLQQSTIFSSALSSLCIVCERRYPDGFPPAPRDPHETLSSFPLYPRFSAVRHSTRISARSLYLNKSFSAGITRNKCNINDTCLTTYRISKYN